MIFTVETSNQVALKSVEGFGERAHELLKARITSLTEALETRVLATEPFRTGRLRETTVEKVFSDDPDRVAGYVRITADFGKAGALEYGSHRAITVNERSPAVRARQAHAGIRAAFSRPSAALAASYVRHTNIAEHRFLRGPLEAMRPEILAEMEQALEEAKQT